MAKAPRGCGAIVEVTLADGQVLRKFIVISEGDAQRPLSQASLEHKFSTFAAPVLGADGAKGVLALIGRLDELDDIRLLTRVLRPA